MHDFENLKNVMKTNDYVMRAIVSESGSCTLELPGRVFEPIYPQQHISYVPKYGKNPGVLVDHLDIDNNEYSETVSCPAYAVRLMIFVEIILVSIHTGYSLALVDFLCGDKPVEHTVFINSIKNPPKSFSSKEKSLVKIYKKLTERNEYNEELSDEASKLNVLEGYISLQNKMCDYV